MKRIKRWIYMMIVVAGILLLGGCNSREDTAKAGEQDKNTDRLMSPEGELPELEIESIEDIEYELIETEPDEEEAEFKIEPANFQGKVTAIKGNSIEMEDAKQELGLYVAHCDEDTEILNKEGEAITLQDLKKGDYINIVFDGVIMESYPAQMNNIVQVEIIEKPEQFEW